MFAVCSIDDSYENICVPMKWFKSINLSAHINQAVNAAELLTVFYSTDKSKYPDFSLPISKNLNDNDSCYRVRLQKFFDSEDGATIFKHRKRSVMPKVYSELKIRKTVNVEDIEWPSEAPILPDPKIATRNEISRKMNAMNKIYIDLSEEELEIVQNLLQDDAVDNFSDPSDFGEITAANNTESTSWDAQNATAVENPVASNESGDSDATYCSFVEDVVNQNVDGQLSSDDEEQSEGDPTASNFLFTPPILCSLNNSVPSYLQRMDPKLFNKLVANTNQLPNIQGESSQNEESPNKDEAEVDADDLKHKLNVMHLHFPGTCVFENGLFVFKRYEVELKYTIVDMIMDWAITKTGRSYLYDDRFVGILLVMIVGNYKLANGLANRKHMDFIKKSYMLRVEKDPTRVSRLEYYIQKNIEKAQAKINKSAPSKKY